MNPGGLGCCAVAVLRDDVDDDDDDVDDALDDAVAIDGGVTRTGVPPGRVTTNTVSGWHHYYYTQCTPYCFHQDVNTQISKFLLKRLPVR